MLKAFMQEQAIDFQLVPPGVHRRNAAERAIRTFKNHFIAGLCSVDKDFPLHLWDRLLPQAILSLNLLRGSAPLISTKRLSRHLVSVSLSMKYLTNIHRGHLLMASMDGT
jgi:hypothetical protein